MGQCHSVVLTCFSILPQIISTLAVTLHLPTSLFLLQGLAALAAATVLHCAAVSGCETDGENDGLKEGKYESYNT